jgi:HAD superfamily hydrolase (TIGR01549 family)
MREADYTILDFDGTIADTLEMVLGVYNRISHEYGLMPVNHEDRELFRTKRSQELLNAFGVSKLKMLSLTLRIRKEMSIHLPEMMPFPGIEAALKEIKNNGCRLGILTSNSVENVRKFLDINNMGAFFDFVSSGRSFLGKEKVIRKVISREQLNPGRVIYVGDETRDIEASRAAGIPVIAVSWGLNRRELLASLLPDHIVDRPEELPDRVRQIFLALKA